MNGLITCSFTLTEGSSNKRIIIGGAVGGACLIILLVTLFVWYKISSKKKANPRGKIYINLSWLLIANLQKTVC